jgi:hypothetical protein
MGLYREPRALFCTAARDDRATGTRLHAAAESVGACAFPFLWLISSFGHTNVKMQKLKIKSQNEGISVRRYAGPP